MRFYFQQRGELTDEGIDYPDAEEALRQAADAALSMAIEQLDETMGSSLWMFPRKTVPLDRSPSGC